MGETLDFSARPPTRKVLRGYASLTPDGQGFTRYFLGRGKPRKKGYQGKPLRKIFSPSPKRRAGFPRGRGLRGWGDSKNPARG